MASVNRVAALNGAAHVEKPAAPPQPEAELIRAYTNTFSDQRRAALVGVLVLEYQDRYARAVAAGGRYDLAYFMESLTDDLGPELDRRGIKS